MTLHTCRDFVSWGNPLTAFEPYRTNYFLACFLLGVLGYTIVGSTNFAITSNTYRLGTGTNGSMNQGGNDVYAFQPNGYSVTVGDIGRILVIKSPTAPMVNSGLFRVTGVNITNNWWYINYRSGDTPPAETGVTWSLFENENVFVAAVNTTGNGIAGTYQGQGTASNSRIVLQSPHSTQWQVRLCYETNYDQPFQGGSVTPTANGGAVTCMPGFGGTAAGDFTPGGQHTHGPLFFNNHVQYSYLGTSMGLWPNGSNQARYYMWGDDSTGTCFAALRTIVGGTDSFIHFGLCINEELPLPPHNAQRLFVIGANGLVNGGNNGIYWACNSGASRDGMAFGLSNQPVSCHYSLYNPLFGGTFGTPSGNNPIRSSNVAGDNQYVAASELLPVDIMVGTQDVMNNYNGTNYEMLILEGRRLGTAPFVQMGRANYGYFQLSTDPTHSWLHLNDGIYLPWQGSILP